MILVLSSVLDPVVHEHAIPFFLTSSPFLSLSCWKMAAVVEFPYPVLSRVIEFLPLADIVNVSKVCQDWKFVASKALKIVKIDASTAYGGSWQKYYQVDEEAVRDNNVENFARDLANCTDEIEHLYFDGNDIPRAVFEILLSSQKALKTLVVKLARKGTFDDPRTDIGKVILQGIVKHENSLEEINLGIEGVFLSFQEMENAFTEKARCFSNLRSIEFLSTTAGSHENGDANDVEASLELRSAELVFQKMFPGSKIEELNFKSKMPLKLYYDGPETFWNPQYIRLLTNHFKFGAFSNLRKINIDSLNTRGTDGEFSNADADLLIENCPHISHIDSDLFFFDINDYRTPVHDEKPYIKIIKHYGPQLVHLHCYTNTNIAQCIVENCPNVETLTIVDHFGEGLSNSVLTDFSRLKKIKKLTIFFQRFYDNLNALMTFLDNCVSRLTKLQIIFQEGTKFDEKIFHIIQENKKSLKTLIVDFEMESFEGYKAAMEAFIQMLDSCTSFRCLNLIINSIDAGKIGKDTWKQYYEKVVQMLVANHADLYQLGLYALLPLPDKEKETLIQSLPYCKMQFDDRTKFCKF